MKKGYVNCNTASIYYEIYGEGRTILFLHGNGEDMTYFNKQKEAFKNEYKLIFIDSRGHGKSTFGKEKLTLDLMSEDILKVLDTLKIQDVDLLGFSDGGNIGILCALKRPDLFRTLTLVGANLKPKDIILSEQIQIKKEVELESNEDKKSILKLMIDEPNIEDDDLKKIENPSLVVAGEHDLIEEECTKRIAHNIKDSKLKIIKDADHFLIDRNSEIFNDIFTEFINNN